MMDTDKEQCEVCGGYYYSQKDCEYCNEQSDKEVYEA